MNAKIHKLSELSFHDWLKGGLVTVVVFIVLQLLVFSGQLTATYVTQHRAIDQLELRIGLDTAFLDVGNQTLGHPVNDAAVRRYLDRINLQLEHQKYPLRIKSIQGIAVSKELADKFADSKRISLHTAEQQINVDLRSVPLPDTLKLSPVSMLGALALTPFLMQIRGSRKRKAKKALEAAKPPQAKLVINLNDKTLGNGVNEKKVPLQNKPFCFYTALIYYCLENPGMVLSQNKDLPPHLIIHANKAFQRLIELGHTKRKRPDFNANLDKTLSEIRAALDDVFANLFAEKEKYYPPRAQGEGSRSKQHSFALPNLKEEDVEIIGE